MSPQTFTCSTKNLTTNQFAGHDTSLDHTDVQKSNEGTPPQERVSIELNIDDNDGDSPIPRTLQTKTAKLVHRAIGDSSDVSLLSLLDKLRAALKEKQKGKGNKPSNFKLTQYRTLTAKLNLQVCSKQKPKLSSLNTHATSNTEPSQTDLTVMTMRC